MTGELGGYVPLNTPLFQDEAEQLAKLWRRTSAKDIQRLMQVSSAKSAEVKQRYASWSTESEAQLPAIDAFRGDIYSGLQVATWQEADRTYAQEHLLILSGLYGALWACDGIRPYRLEMGYRLPNGKSMYDFWGNKLAQAITPETTHIVNLSAVEYTKALLPCVKQEVITPKFMTISPKNGEPTFVTVHAKIARGAFARWMITNRIDDVDRLREFAELEYRYDAELSTPEQPVFVCKTFKGIGLSVRT